jgi:hypothetical protein
VTVEPTEAPAFVSRVNPRAGRRQRRRLFNLQLLFGRFCGALRALDGGVSLGNQPHFEAFFIKTGRFCSFFSEKPPNFIFFAIKLGHLIGDTLNFMFYKHSSLTARAKRHVKTKFGRINSRKFK